MVTIVVAIHVTICLALVIVILTSSYARMRLQGFLSPATAGSANVG